MDQETIKMLLKLLNPLHTSLVAQTYDEKRLEGFNASPDEVTVFNKRVAEEMKKRLVKQERNLSQAVLILEARLKNREELLAWAKEQLAGSVERFPYNDSRRQGYQIAYREIIEKLEPPI